jgi:hypothetical protein
VTPGDATKPYEKNHRDWVCALVAVAVVVLFALVLVPMATADESVTACGGYPNVVFEPDSAYGISATSTCPGGNIALDATALYASGQGAVWQAAAPAGLEIVGGAVPPAELYSLGVNVGSSGQYGGDFYWQGGSSNITPGETSLWVGPLASSYFGFLLVCGKPTCSGLAGPGEITVGEIVLAVHETTGPTMTASGLWQQGGWLRGTWPLGFSGDSPSGLCAMYATLGGQSLPGSSSSQSPWMWHQCDAPAASDSVVTEGYGEGARTLALSATDAAGNSVSYSTTVYVDNQQPTISLSGPSQAAATAGTQYVTATAAAGPSGVDGISCTVDGGPAHWYPSARAQMPVAGVGTHTVRCYSANNAVASNGYHGVSSVASFSMQIGVPTVSAIAFFRVADQLRCHRATERVLVRAHWVRVRGRRVRRHARAETRHVTKCHPRTVLERRTVSVRVRRHGRIARVKRVELVRVVVLPHVVGQTTRRVGHGQSTTVSGWLGTYNGVALAGQTVEVLTAPDDGQDAFTTTATAATASNGSWTATLPAGPSRLVEAQYAGGGDAQGSVSGTVTEIVPAKVKLLNIYPRKVAWGHTIHIVGQLEGGYLPAGGALVRLRIGLGAAYTTYGVHEHVGGDGRFTTAYTFGVGDASQLRSYWFQIASLPMGDYPYAPANSRKLSVLVGGHPTSRWRHAHSR